MAGSLDSVFPQPVQPEAEPFAVIEAPPHISNEIWQTSYYDASSHAAMGAFVQLPAGPCSIETGRLTDGDWPANPHWKQV